MQYTKSQLAATIDHTILKPDTLPSDIERLCTEAIQYNFASCCVNPTFVPQAKELLAGSNVKVCTVIGFPLGANASEIKYNETELAIFNGATEIDMVINIGRFIGGDLEYTRREISTISHICKTANVLLKVIVETCLLQDAQIAEITKIVEDAGADYIKTSTGFSSSGASLNDIKIFKQNIKGDLKIKASGGIRDLKFALELLEAGAERLGTSSGIKIVESL